MSADTALMARDTASAVAGAEEAVRRARLAVGELRETTASAVRVLQDAEFDSAKARLSDRGDYYLEIAAEHLERLQTRCTPLRDLADELGHHLERAASAVTDAQGQLSQLSNGPEGAAPETAYLQQRLAVVAEMVDVARPLAMLASHHVETAAEESRTVTTSSLLEPRSLEHSLRTAGQEISRADEDLRLIDTVVERATANARQSAGLAEDISDRAAERMQTHRDHQPAAHVIAPRAPTR